MKNVYLGTSAWVAAATKTGDSFKHGAAAIQSADPAMNLIAGITESAGANIEWIRDQFFRHEKEKYGAGVFNYMDEVIAAVPPGSDGLICTPWMLGERCPVSSTTTRATLFNITMVHTREHLMRAVYEGIAYNIRWILQNFCKDYNIACDNIRIIGGGALDKGWMQILSDITGRNISVVENPRNAGAVGAAVVALIGLGELPENMDPISKLRLIEPYQYTGVLKETPSIELFQDFNTLLFGVTGVLSNTGALSEMEKVDGLNTLIGNGTWLPNGSWHKLWTSIRK